MEPQRNGPEGASPPAAPAVTGTALPNTVKRAARTPQERDNSDRELPPVWIRLPDVGPDATPARQVEPFDTDAEPSDQQQWPRLGADSARQGSSLVTIAAVAILAITLYLVLPGRERGQPPPPDNGPPPAWNASPSAGRWKGPTAESLPTGEAQPPPQEGQTVGTPPDDVATPLDQRFGAAPPWRITPAEPKGVGAEHFGLAELDGTIETNTLHRARREPPDAILY